MTNVMGTIDGDAQTPVEVEGYAVLCCDCGAVIGCDTTDERDELHSAGFCPSCGGGVLCGCRSCIRGGL